MKRITALLSVALLTACSQNKPPLSPIGTTDSRIHIPLTQWNFFDPHPTPNTLIIPTSVTLPHTWNALDGTDGGDNYYRGKGTYTRTLNIPANWKDKTLLLKFEGANRQTNVFINDQPIGSHLGGFAAFTFDITHAVHPGNNQLTVTVDNSGIKDSPPLSADFTFYGGLYRPVELITLNPIHISPLDYASPGVKVRTDKVTDEVATIFVDWSVQNTLPENANVRVITHIYDAENKEVARSSTGAIISPGNTLNFIQNSLFVWHPHLWNGVVDPYLYHVKVDILHNGQLADSVTQPLGIRIFSIDPQKGFILNGHPYNLHGVCRHQDREGKGWAISNADHEEDMALIREMGCTAIRLAHYQHSEYFYQLCDKEGLIVWAEVPVVNDITPTKAFTDNAEQQLRELIRQNINHPSICFWSIGNEVMGRFGDPRPLFQQMNSIAHAEDPSRITTMAFAVPKKEENSTKEWPREWWGITDTVGQNRYSGWYRGALADFRTFVEHQPSEAISEYGAGASIYFHSETPQRYDHSEEYQCIFHETYWPAIHENPHIWGSFIWNMFDFGVDRRKEGDHAGINNKGLVTYDRKNKKDAFYYYKANWSPEPTIHLNDKRFPIRGLDHINIKVYSNAPEVELLINGQPLGKKPGHYATFTWENVPLKTGANTVIARATLNGKTIEDTTTWTYKPGAPTEVDIPQDETMREELKKGPPRAPIGDASLPARK